MLSLTRRQFSAAALGLASPARRLLGATANTTGIAEALRTGVEKRGIPCATAIVANANSVIYYGAFGKRDSASSLNATTGSIFRIASMTKAITTTAALQLVEQGKLTLDEPVAQHLPQLAKLEVLEGFDNSGKPILRARQNSDRAEAPADPHLRIRLSHLERDAGAIQ